MESDKTFKGTELENRSYDELQHIISNNEEDEYIENETNCNTESIISKLLSFFVNAIISVFKVMGTIYLMLFREILSSSGKTKRKTKRKYYYSWRKGWY